MAGIIFSDHKFAATDTPHAPWYVVMVDDKKRARLNCIAHLLNRIPYEEIPREDVHLPELDPDGAFDDMTILASRSLVLERF